MNAAARDRADDETGSRVAPAASLTPAQSRSNRRALAALLAVTLLAAVAAGIGLVGRIVDTDAARPNRSGASTLDGRRPPEVSTKGADDVSGLLVVTIIGLVAAACVAVPLLRARRRRRAADGMPALGGESGSEASQQRRAQMSRGQQ